MDRGLFYLEKRGGEWNNTPPPPNAEADFYLQPNGETRSAFFVWISSGLLTGPRIIPGRVLRAVLGAAIPNFGGTGLCDYFCRLYRRIEEGADTGNELVSKKKALIFRATLTY